MVEDSLKNNTPSPGKSGADRILGAIDRLLLKAWRLYTSLKFGIFLLVVIGVAAIYGTMGFASNAALGDNGIPMARAHFFETKWFIALLLLFAVNLIFSTWHVTKMSFGIWGKREFRRGRTYYDHGSGRAEVKVPGGPEEVHQFLSRYFTRAHRDGNFFFAHKGLLSRIGPTIVHIGILIVIGAVSAKAILIWQDRIITEGRFIAAEGETTHVLHEPLDYAQQITDQNRRERDLGLWIKVLDFDEIKFPNSETPAYFSSLVEVRDPKTQKVTVAQLDMNHSLHLDTSLGKLQFHQAGYQAVPDTDLQRVNFDVRDKDTGERIAVTDTHPGNRVRVGDTDLFLEVDGVAPASRWRLYKQAAPDVVHAEGLLTGGKEISYSFQPLEFYPDLQIDPQKKEPFNASNEPRNPALKVGIFLDDKQVETSWLFVDPQFANLMPSAHPRYRLQLEDVRTLKSVSLDQVKWNEPGQVVFLIGLYSREDGTRLGQELLAINEKSNPIVYRTTVDHAQAPLGTEKDFEVRVVGPTTRYLTVLSVVNEPTVWYTNLGVAVLVLGAVMTFLFRYRAFYGMWDEEKQTLRFALVPRWGQSPVKEEFDALVEQLSHGAGVVRKVEVETAGEEVAPEHETVNPLVART